MVNVEPAAYRLRDFPIGRGGVKYSLTGEMAFTQTISSTGVSLTLRSGKKVFISSAEPDALARAIQTVPMQVRVAAPDEVADDLAREEAEEEEANVKASRRA